MSKKITTFFYVLKKTLTSPLYYKDILAAPFSFSFKFFTIISFIVSLIISVYFLNSFIWTAPQYATKILPKATELYPSELQITIKNGVVSTNVAEPYVISMESIYNKFDLETRELIQDDSMKYKNMLVIDTKGKLENFSSYDTLLLLTDKYLIYSRRANSVEFVSLKDTKDVVINKTLVNSIIKQFTPIIKQVIIFGSLFIFFSMILINMLSVLLYLLFFAAVLWLTGKLMHYPLTYAKSYQMGLHLSIFSLLIFSMISLFALPIHFPFLRTIVLSLIAIYIFQQLKVAKSKK